TMSLMIDLTPEEEARLSELAKQEGLPPEEYVRRRLLADLIRGAGPDPKGEALARQMEAWIEEDSAATPEELEAREAEWQQLKADLNANRKASGERRLFP
ncbi:MAG TPA: hypothetical protein VKU00_19950, partial [Chthonomonadaceae bacterium]|nr:hypothetical protein [Chthonomonadaceae bacterium]